MSRTERKVLSVEIPFSNAPLTFDFSDIYGKPIYNTKTIVYTCFIKEKSEEKLFNSYYNICNWLLNTVGIQQLSDSFRKGYYYKSKCTSISTLERIGNRAGSFTVNFKANPLMTSFEYLDYVWDDIIFTKDNINAVYYPGVANQYGKTYTIYNSTDCNYTPKISVEGGNCKVTLNGIQHTLNSGDKDIIFDDFIIIKGENTINCIGAGKVFVSTVEEVL